MACFVGLAVFPPIVQFFSYDNLTLARPNGYLHTPRSRGGGVDDSPGRFASNWARASRKKWACGPLRDAATQRLVPTQLQGLRSTSDLRDQTNDPKMSGFGFWLMTPPSVAAKPKLKHHRNNLIKPRQTKSFLSGKGQSPSSHELSLGDQKSSVDSGGQCNHDGAFLDSLSQFDRKLLRKNADDQKGPLRRTQCQKWRNKVGRHDS